ncbi:helix-turn-helix domain-containing protein [Streptomyces sp. NPDC021212]|uniref:helix-turn-helix domain-containing protein n=1 Tax=Streptomyces sp. NPDC021212 TaxID=3365118 RepID=UPI0037BD3B59
MSKSYHTSWTIPEEHRADPAYVEASAAIDLGQGVYDRRTSLGIDQASLAERTGLSVEEIGRLEGGGTVPTLPLVRMLARAFSCPSA